MFSDTSKEALCSFVRELLMINTIFRRVNQQVSMNAPFLTCIMSQSHIQNKLTKMLDLCLFLGPQSTSFDYRMGGHWKAALFIPLCNSFDLIMRFHPCFQSILNQVTNTKIYQITYVSSFDQWICNKIANASY